MPDEKKKNYIEHNGNSVYQEVKSSFVEDYTTWRTNCQGIGSETLKVKHIPNLYIMLKKHLDGNIRSGSRNASNDGKGAIQFLDFMDDIVDGFEKFTNGHAQIITTLAKQLAAMEGTGEVAGEKGDAFDPAFILFSESRMSAANEKLAPKVVQGHYATEWYADRNEGITAVDPTWLTGNNPPHEALFSENDGPFSKPKGLLYIMLEAADEIPDTKNSVEVASYSGGTDADDIDGLSAIEDFFNKVVKENSYWNAGGRLLVNKVKKELQTTSFNLSNLDQNLIREIANLGSIKEKDGLAGVITTFKLTATATPIITLVDRALKRKNTNKAPNGYRAWQNQTKRGFDYRKTAEEKWGKLDSNSKYKPDAKVISKLWQQHLWN